MKRLICMVLFVLVLSTASVTVVHASLTVQAIIDRDVHVVFILKKLDPTLYDKIKRSGASFDSTTIPRAIIDYLKTQNLMHAAFSDAELQFDDSNNAIHVSFRLSGPDIVNLSLNRTRMAMVYHVRVEWRKLRVNLTEDFLLDLDKFFGVPMNQWQVINYTDLENVVHPALYYSHAGSGDFDPTCYFILPPTATHIRTLSDMIIFEVPLPPEEKLLHSPLIIVGALIILNVAALIYRKIR